MAFLAQILIISITILIHRVRSNFVFMSDPTEVATATEVNNGSHFAPVFIEMYIDILDRNCKTNWDILTSALNGISNNDVRLVLYQFPLPWHRNAYLTTEGFFYVKDEQPKYAIRYAKGMLEDAQNLTFHSTMHLTELEVIWLLGNMASTMVPGLNKIDFQKSITASHYHTLIKQGIRNGFQRGVKNVPWFFVNGAAIIPVGKAGITVADWKNLIKKIIGEQKAERKFHKFAQIGCKKKGCCSSATMASSEILFTISSTLLTLLLGFIQ